MLISTVLKQFYTLLTIGQKVIDPMVIGLVSFQSSVKSEFHFHFKKKGKKVKMLQLNDFIFSIGFS